MKKFLTFVSVLFVSFCIFSESFGFGVDLGVIQDPIISKSSVQANLDFRFSFEQNYELRIPVSADFTFEDIFIEGGLTFVYYPWQKGMFIGLSAVQFGYSVKNSIGDKYLFNLNEVVAGWTFDLPLGFFVEPSVLMRNPSGTFDDEYSALLGAFPNYTKFRFRLLLGWKYSK